MMMMMMMMMMVGCLPPIYTHFPTYIHQTHREGEEYSMGEIRTSSARKLNNKANKQDLVIITHFFSGPSCPKVINSMQAMMHTSKAKQS